MARGPFSFFSVVLGKYKYVAISRNPTNAWALLQQDAQREVPWTYFGQQLKAATDAPQFRVECSGLWFKEAHAKLQETLHACHFICDYLHCDVAWYDRVYRDYSQWDDAWDLSDVTGHAHFPEAPPPLLFCAWGSTLATLEFERLFFHHPEPLSVLQGDTAIDIMATAFYHMCVNPRNHVSHGCVWNQGHRVVVVRTPDAPWFKEISCTEFAEMTVPWLAKTLDHLCRGVLAGNRTTGFDWPAAVQRCHEVLRKLYVDTGHGPVIHVLCAKPEDLRHLKHVGRGKSVTEATRRIVHILKDEANNTANAVATFEKLRRLYPPGHERSPEYAQFRKRIHRAQGMVTDPILDENLLKPKKQAEKQQQHDCVH